MSERARITISVGPTGVMVTRPTVTVEVDCHSSYRESTLEYAAKCVEAILEARKKVQA